MKKKIIFLLIFSFAIFIKQILSAGIYKSIQPEERYISDKNNPPKVSIQFYDNLKNLNNINCFSNEEDKWRNSKIKFDSKNNYLSKKGYPNGYFPESSEGISMPSDVRKINVTNMAGSHGNK